MAEKMLHNMDEIIKELMKKDRTYYLEILMQSVEPLTSYEITEKMLISEGFDEKSIDKDLLRKKSPSINSRLRTLEKMDILKNKNGKYSIDIAGQLFLHAREKLSESREIVEKHRKFLETHNFQDIPVEFRWQTYKLRRTTMIHNAFDFIDNVKENLKNVERKIYLLTEHLRDIPDEVIQRISKREIDIAILYQCRNPPKIEGEDEKEVFRKLTKNSYEGIEFRFLPLHKKSPIYTCRADSKWALFTLSALSSRKLDRNQAFCGDDIEFITWCRDLLYHLWWEKDIIALDIEDIVETNSL